MRHGSQPLYSHKSVVDESPLSGSLQHVVEVILELPVAGVPAAALRAVGQRLPQQAEPGALVVPNRSRRSTCRGRGQEETVPDARRVVIHRPASALHIPQRVALLRPAPTGTTSGGLHPEPRAAALVAAGVTPRHHQRRERGGVRFIHTWSRARVFIFPSSQRDVGKGRKGGSEWVDSWLNKNKSGSLRG